RRESTAADHRRAVRGRSQISLCRRASAADGGGLSDYAEESGAVRYPDRWARSLPGSGRADAQGIRARRSRTTLAPVAVECRVHLPGPEGDAGLRSDNGGTDRDISPKTDRECLLDLHAG